MRGDGDDGVVVFVVVVVVIVVDEEAHVRCLGAAGRRGVVEEEVADRDREVVGFGRRPGREGQVDSGADAWFGGVGIWGGVTAAHCDGFNL